MESPVAERLPCTARGTLGPEGPDSGGLALQELALLCVAVSRPHVVMTLQLTGLALKACLSYVLILGAFGLPAMGAVGGAVASVIVFWSLGLLGIGYMRRSAFSRLPSM